MTVGMYRHPENWLDRDIYRNRVIALPTYFVGRCVIEDGPDAVESFVKATVETSMADMALGRVRSVLWSHTGGRATLTNGGGPGSADYIELRMGKYTGTDDVFPGEWRWVVNIGWDEVSADESPDYYIRLTFGAHIENERGDEEHLWDYETVPFGTEPSNSDVLDVAEAVAKYCARLELPVHESPWTV